MSAPIFRVWKQSLICFYRQLKPKLKVFVSIYGSEAGNLALKMLATNGIYLGGGIAPKILDALKLPIFLESFSAKGRMRSLPKKIPIRVVLNEKTALLGATHFAQVSNSKHLIVKNFK
jgi:glucokinase